jgi:hypothetical protein
MATGNVHLSRITGHASKALQCYQQVSTVTAQTVNFYAFKPVGGDVTLTSLTDINGGDATAYDDDGTYYENVRYAGSFSGIQVLTGTVLLYLSEQ